MQMARTWVAALALMAGAPAAADGWSIALHGGAGVIERGRMSAEEEAQIRAALGQALDAGATILAAGGSAVDAVVAAVALLEEAPQFNAGVGAVFTSAGTIELDAAVMDGRNRALGAVAGVTRTRSPVALARRLMERGPHVFLAGEGAEAFARAERLEEVANSHFMTDRRRRQLEDLRQQGQGALRSGAERFGTVGAVARDRAGHLAAATSTGGLTGKAPGRIGDAPVAGAGTIAEDGACAVSATGSGELFLRARVAGQICDRIRFGGATLAEASEQALGEMAALGGSGGLVAVDAAGVPALPMTTSGMYRAAMTSEGLRQVAIYADE
jgi:beta-aspartyl-peptidase (threonine type)